MKSIIIYYGPKKGYEQIIPDSKKTLVEIVSAHDSKMNTHLLVVHQEGKQEIKDIEVEKLHIDNVVAYSESYACITEGAIQSFLTILNDYNIDNLYLQNPPKQIVTQLEQTYPKIIKVKRYNYQRLTGRMFKRLANQFNTKIIGQDDVKEKLLVALYPLLNKNKNSKPIVIMFYGESGVEKTETAKLISNIIGQKLFRKQFSMFQNMKFSNYLFGGKHSQDSFAKDLLERESNVILIDEFSNDSLRRIIDKLINKKYNELTKNEQKILDLDEIKQKMYTVVEKIKNVRNVDIIIQELIGMQLVKNFLENKK